MKDRTFELLREGYSWAQRVRGGASAVPVRLLGRRAALVGGPEGVRRFYDERLRRRGALPPPVALVLFGPGTVHGLDDTAHHHRKAWYVDLLTAQSVALLGERAEREWKAAVGRWASRDRVVLFDEAVQVLGAAVLDWAGVPVPPAQLPGRARQLASVVDGFATPGPTYARAAWDRVRLDRWAAGLVRSTRADELQPPPGSALASVAALTGRDGRALPATTAGVALLNVVCPTVAVAWFVTFAGLALHEYPEWRDRIRDGDDAALGAFAHEVRRAAPFVPVLAAKARTAQDVLGVSVPRGGLVVLDVHGTDHDPRQWPDPERFDPGRFLADGTMPQWDPDALVPQGGGDVRTGHRCPGEDVVLTMIAVATRVLAGLAITLPAQDLRMDLRRVPTRPRSGVVLQPLAGAEPG